MDADVRIDNGKLVYGQESCTCMNGKVYGYKACPMCHGTGRTKGGKGKGRCRACLNGRVVDTSTKVDCGRCHGTAQVQADRYSYVPNSIVQGLPIEIHRCGRPQSFNEAYLGLGMILSVTDYGEHQKLTDEQFREKVKGSLRSVQGCKVSDKEDRLCRAIGVYCNRQGYSLIPEF